MLHSNGLRRLLRIPVFAFFVAVVIFAQQRTTRSDSRESSFDARQISGIWSRNTHGYGGGGVCKECGDRGYSNVWPVFTPEGQKLFDLQKPSYGRNFGSTDAAQHPEEHIGRRRSVPPAKGNDLYQYCNPQGLPRSLIYPDPFEFVVLPDRIIQEFEWHHDYRTIWLDGRQLPPRDVDEPRWWGYSVGKWNGDVLVVDSVGFDERTWIDQYGYPHSREMHLQERYRRVDANWLELKMTVDDPKIYAQPWVSETKHYKLYPQSAIKTVDGWAGLREDSCAPVDDFVFNDRIRDPAGGGRQ